MKKVLGKLLVVLSVCLMVVPVMDVQARSRDIAELSISLSKASYTYDGLNHRPSVKVSDLVKDRDYTVTYPSDCKNVGIKKITIKGINDYTGTVTVSYKINAASITKLSFNYATFTYDGKAKYPLLTVSSKLMVVASRIYKSNSNVNVSMSLKNKKPGTYNVSVTGKGNFKGTIKRTYKIVVKSTSLKSLEAIENGFKVNWYTRSNNYISGYQVQYSTTSGFTKDNHTRTISSYKTGSTTFKSLKANKKYYVRIRTYKTISDKKYYSSYSSKKSVTTKGSSTAEANAPVLASGEVYVTDTEYHNHVCGNMGYMHILKLDEAKRRGLKPCRKCYH